MKRLMTFLVLCSFTLHSTPSSTYAISKVLDFEGSKIDKNLGNIHSKYGITRPTLKAYNGRTDIENLTESMAIKLMEDMYWAEYNLESIIDRRSGLLVLDFLYNSNSTNAIKQIQLAIGHSVTGKLSITNLARINYLGYKAFYEVYSKQRLGYMKKLSVWSKFKNGWTARINKLGGL